MSYSGNLFRSVVFNNSIGSEDLEIFENPNLRKFILSRPAEDIQKNRDPEPAK